MKSRKLGMGVLVMTLVFGTMLIGCPTETETYTVWTDTISHTEFNNTFLNMETDSEIYAGTEVSWAVPAGYFRRELTSSQFNEITPSLKNEDKHIWTEDQLYNWFIGRGYDNTQANREKAWFISINHGFIAGKNESIVYMLIK
jgi:hypothetical protein